MSLAVFPEVESFGHSRHLLILQVVFAETGERLDTRRKRFRRRGFNIAKGKRVELVMAGKGK